jgi:hypothetical protein
VLVNGAVGLVVAPRRRLFRVLRFPIADRRIVHVDIVADATQFRELDLSILDDG